MKIKQSNLVALIVSLIGTVRNFKLKKQNTEWGEYYTFTNYTDRSFEHKKEIISRYVKEEWSS